MKAFKRSDALGGLPHDLEKISGRLEDVERALHKRVARPADCKCGADQVIRRAHSILLDISVALWDAREKADKAFEEHRMCVKEGA